MADIRDLSIPDLREFLSANDIYDYRGALSVNRTKSFDDIYNIAFDLMKNKNTKYDDVPISIIEWMLAHNALQRKINIPSYTRSQIEKLSANDLNRLSKLLGLSKDNIDNVINILRYMRKLKESELDFEINTDLYTNLLLNSNFQTIIDLLKAKPSLKDRISELFYDILIYNKGINDFYGQTYKGINGVAFYSETSNFVESLIDLRYFDLIEKILPIISEDDNLNYINLVELFAEKRYLDKYFKYFPKKYRPIFRLKVANTLNNTKVSPYYLIDKILETAINNKNLDMINSILDKLKISRNFDEPNKFYGISLELTDEQENNLRKLIHEANKLVINL